MRMLLVAISLALIAARAQAMELKSPDFNNGARFALAQVNSRCGGSNRSPALAWSGAPSGTRAYALTLFDPDAGGGRGFWHWLVLGIPASETGLPENAGSGSGLPHGATQAENDFGEAGYGGACPPTGSGVHHYVFTLYAMKDTATPNQSSGGELAAFLKAHALATAMLTGLYSR